MSENLPARSYPKRFFAVAGALLLLVISVNLIVDPYNTSQLVHIKTFNLAKPREWDYARLKKPFDVWGRHYDGVAFGTSQVERGIDPSYTSLTRNRISLYNFGLSSLRIYETALLLGYVAETSDVKFALVMLDFSRYLPPRQPDQGALPKDWSLARLVGDYLKTLISRTALADSWLTLRRNVLGFPPGSPSHLPTGLLDLPSFFDTWGWPDYRLVFDQTDSTYLNSQYSDMLSAQDRLRRSGFDHAALAEVLRVARTRHIQLHFFIPPNHVREMEVIWFLGLWPLFEQWKTELVCALEAEAQTAGAVPFPLWDFSGWNAITTEPVPPAGNATRMTWYYDSFHFTPRAGSAILNRILFLDDSEFSALEDFGTLRTSRDFAHQSAQMLEARAAYISRHPEVRQEIAALYRGSSPLNGR
jgi:hypothetical protein